MLMFRAKRRFKLHYFEQLLRGETSEVAADRSLSLTKAEIQELLNADHELSESAKQRIWGNIFDDLVEWQSLLIGIPIDRSQLDKVKHVVDELSVELQKSLPGATDDGTR